MTLYLRDGDLVEQRPWSDEDLAEAIRMRRALIGSSAIARKLKRSRNSVIGALHRAGVQGTLVNQHGEGDGRWSFADRSPRLIPLRFSEQANG